MFCNSALCWFGNCHFFVFPFSTHCWLGYIARGLSIGGYFFFIISFSFGWHPKCTVSFAHNAKTGISSK